MDLKLVRDKFRQDGIFGTLFDSSGRKIAVTLEHAYVDLTGWSPKVPEGQYLCIRGQHQLASMTQPFETFMILNVPGHTGILFHSGNYNCDSDGCILVGTDVTSIDGALAISSSRLAFLEFMDLQTGVDNFSLSVSSSI